MDYESMKLKFLNLRELADANPNNGVVYELQNKEITLLKSKLTIATDALESIKLRDEQRIIPDNYATEALTKIRGE
jgi:hypothetical protein